MHFVSVFLLSKVYNLPVTIHKTMSEATFHLYDLRVEVIEGDKPFVCSHQLGDAFEVRGENLHFKTERPFSLYALAALLPLLTPKQRPLNHYDWMATDHIIACPDPHCGARFKISRIGKRMYNRSATTIVPLPEQNDWIEKE
jgi:uncharacterized repeat protein (TIGR04076 family)